MSMTHYSVHHNERLFPDSHSFVPERWLDHPDAPALVSSLEQKQGDLKQKTKKLSRYMVSFNKGTRNCIGMQFAWSQLYFMIANVVRRCDLEIFETEWKDVGFVRDFGISMPAKDSRGLRVLVHDVV